MVRSGESERAVFHPGDLAATGFGLLGPAAAAKAIRPTSRFSSIAGCGDSKSTATSVPMGKNGSEPVSATLRTNCGPNSRAMRAHRQSELCLISFYNSGILRARLGQPQHGRVVPARLVGLSPSRPQSWERRPRADRRECKRPGRRAWDAHPSSSGFQSISLIVIPASESIFTGSSLGRAGGNSRSSCKFSLIARPPVNRSYVRVSSSERPGCPTVHRAAAADGVPGVARRGPV